LGRLFVLEHVGEPVQTLIETITACGASGLDVPRTVAESMETELVGNLGNGHGVGKILEKAKIMLKVAPKTQLLNS
jgi:hypothetical protein